MVAKSIYLSAPFISLAMYKVYLFRVWPLHLIYLETFVGQMYDKYDMEDV